MNNRDRRSLLTLVCSLLMMCVLLGLLAPAPVQADVGVMPILPGGSNLKPEASTPIRMAAEVVTMNVRPATAADNDVILLDQELYFNNTKSAWYQAVAEVQADFTMKNPTNEAVSMTVWFPLASVLKGAAWYEFNPDEMAPRINRFQVNVDGTPLEYAVSELPNPAGAEAPLLPWASFPVTFPAGTETMIHVSYVLPLLPMPKSYALALYYIFQTGAGWAGSIGQAELIINLPYPASTETLAGMPPNSLNPPYFIYRGESFADLPPGAVLEGNQARWTWKNLEPGPQDDFSILLMHPAGWEALQANRDAVATRPDDGQAWWNLCTTYYYGSRRRPGIILPGYTRNYPDLGVEACQAAARFLPFDASPHYVLAAFYLAALSKNPTLKTLQPALIELELGRQLEDIRPPSEVYLPEFWEEVSNSEWIGTNIANIYKRTPNPTWYATLSAYIAETAESVFTNATATAEQVTRAAKARATMTPRPSATASPTLKPTQTSSPSPGPTQSPSSTVTPPPTFTLTPSPSTTLVPSTTPRPSPTILPTTAKKPSSGQSAVPIVAASVVGLFLAGYLGWRILRRRSRK
jgi:Domain of unknown function (DUF4424)